MKTFIIVFHLILSGGLGAGAQQKALNIPGIHQLVSDSRAEHEKQQLASDKQRINSINEEVNRTMLAKLKTGYRVIQDRFNFIGTVLSASEIAIQAIPLVTSIAADQATLLQMAQKDPLLVFLVYQTETDILYRSKDLLSYLLGLSASIGTVNQMKISDRKMLFDFVLAELAALKQTSARLITILLNSDRATLSGRLNPFADYVNADRALVNDILRNAKFLKK